MNAEWTAAAADTFTVFDVDAFFLLVFDDGTGKWVSMVGF